ANGQFALTIDGDNAVLKERMEEVNRLRRNGLSTVPSTLAEEFYTNPFLRAGDRNIQKNLGLVGGDDVTVFAKMRENKDRF
ncbi:MAG: hydroxyacylglutathione hydrolase C-terminal domain-containing protein, partial [Methylococcales bacterium]